jgi:hypothetical protein
VDDVGALGLQQALERVVMGRDAVADRDLLGHEQLQVADGDDPGAIRHLLDLFDVTVGDLAAAHDCDLEGHEGRRA